MLMTGGAEPADIVTFAADRRVRMRGERVTAGADPAGLVVRLDLVAPAHDRGRGVPQPRRAHPPRALAPLGGGSSASPAAASAYAETRAALSNADRVVVVGEPGSGRCTALVSAFHQLHPGARIIEVEAGMLEAANVAGLEALGHPGSGPALVVLRDLDHLDGAGARVASRLLAGAAGRGRLLVAATARDVDSDHRPELRRVLPHIDVSVTLPPLRRRPDDLATIVAQTFGELAPGRRVRLGTGAMRLVRAYSWPGNLPELREALATALARRPVGEIRAEDLPASCHAVPKRTLTRLEAQERDAIVEALHECHGNRAAAAQRLGIARSSLYRKLHTYALEHA
jgi:ActR/RegA family two-component response regulator